VLVEVARRTMGNVRGFDLVARYGGEEFVVVMPESALNASGAVADRLRRAIGERVVEVSIGPRTLPVTVSIGVAVSGPDAMTPAQLLRNADEALYAAKRAGRNRVMLWEREGTSAFVPDGILP